MFFNAEVSNLVNNRAISICYFSDNKLAICLYRYSASQCETDTFCYRVIVFFNLTVLQFASDIADKVCYPPHYKLVVLFYVTMTNFASIVAITVCYSPHCELVTLKKVTSLQFVSDIADTVCY